MSKALAGVVLAVILAACAEELVWAKPGMTEAEFRKDAYECERDARMVPPGGYSPRLPTAETGFTRALSRGAEARNMEEFQARCMQAKGYTKARKQAGSN